MSIQVYVSKKNFDVQKTERFFKERRINVQQLDLKKHKLGDKELQVFAGREGLQRLIDTEDKKVKEHPACYYDRDSMLTDAIKETPWLLKSPIVRCGSQITVGYCPDVWIQWLEQGKA